jgi:Spy/CpxP family protein refolding chaperone
MFVASLEELNLPADKKAAIESILADLKKDEAQAMQAGQAVAKDLADGVAASRVDRAKIDADVKQIQKAVEAAKPALQDALNRLHKALDSAERTKLVETMRAKGEAMRQGGHPAMGEMKKLTDELGLTPEQQEKIKSTPHGKMQSKTHPTRDEAAMHDKMKAIGDAFMTDKFDAKALDVGKHNAEMVKMMTTGMSEFAGSLIGVLTPEQREKLAAHIRMRANAPE